jgi:hypothetical protein
VANVAGRRRRTRTASQNASAKTATDYANLKADVKRLGKTAKQLIRACIIILPLVIILLQTNSAEMIQDFILSRKPFTLYEITIVLWFACWVFGAPFDVDMQEEVFIADEDKGNIGFRVIATMAGLLLIATAFLYLYKIETAFQLGLLVFVAANFAAHKIVMQRSRRAIERSRAIMTDDRDMFGLEKVRVVEEYLLGDWQTRRFHAMLAMAGIQLAVAALWRFTRAGELLNNLMIGGIAGSRLSPFVPALLFSLFVAVAEAWIMYRRGDTKAAIKSLDALSLRYALRPKAASVA